MLLWLNLPFHTIQISHLVTPRPFAPWQTLQNQLKPSAGGWRERWACFKQRKDWAFVKNAWHRSDSYSSHLPGSIYREHELYFPSPVKSNRKCTENWISWSRGCQLLLELIARWESNTLRSWSQQRLVHLLVSKLVSCCSRRTEVKQVLNSVVDKGSVENGLRKKKGGKKITLNFH